MAEFTIHNMLDFEILEHGIRKQAERYERLMTSPKITDQDLLDYGRIGFQRCTEMLEQLNQIRTTVGTLKTKRDVQN